jgi:hypothetical protein
MKSRWTVAGSSTGTASVRSRGSVRPGAASADPSHPYREFVAAVRCELLIWPGRIDPMSTGSLAYAVLSICRSLCLVETGRPVAKRESAHSAALS